MSKWKAGDIAVPGGKPRPERARKSHCPKGHEYSEENSIWAYYRSPKDRWTYSCRQCHQVVCVVGYNPERNRRSARKRWLEGREWHQLHPEKVKEHSHAEYLRHREAYIERAAIYRASHKEQIATRDAVYRAKHREQIAARKADYYYSMTGFQYAQMHLRQRRFYGLQRIAARGGIDRSKDTFRTQLEERAKALWQKKVEELYGPLS